MGSTPESMRRVTRSTSTWVLPEPALAPTQAEAAGLEAVFCSGVALLDLAINCHPPGSIRGSAREGHNRKPLRHFRWRSGADRRDRESGIFPEAPLGGQDVRAPQSWARYPPTSIHPAECRR